MNAPVATASTGDYLAEHPNIWWRADAPSEIHMTFVSGEMTDEAGGRPGLWITFSSNPRSANYHPANFNRCARWLAGKGKPAPAEVAVGERKLSVRFNQWRSSK
jgi:hypothetical protein